MMLEHDTKSGGTSQGWEGSAREQRPRYEILRVVNRGGMGEIALAHARGSKGFEKLVVLKRLRADAEREDHLAMFDVEQELMSRIEHPNIVKVFDQPVIDGIPYLAMEYIRGRNLDQIVRAAQQAGEDVPPQLALSVIAEVLRGLAFVHRLKDGEGRPLGVVHQDMTPSNVLVSFFGEVKITDFGISYVTSRDGGLRKGVLKGKPRYVAPEVLAGKRVNNTADIYGVGVVMYELFTGRVLFARNTVKETLAAVAKNELPDFRKEFGHLGEGVPQILERALKKDPNDRYRTAEAMAADVFLELSKRGGPIPPAALGHKLRLWFRDDPDVPEMDPALEQAIIRGATGGLPGLVPVDLDQTLLELDRLLGKDKSADVFAVPPELESELAGLEDMDPFMAATPIPDFVWSAKDEADLLAKADQAFRESLRVREPALLFAPSAPPPLDVAGHLLPLKTSAPTQLVASEPLELRTTQPIRSESAGQAGEYSRRRGQPDGEGLRADSASMSLERTVTTSALAVSSSAPLRPEPKPRSAKTTPESTSRSNEPSDVNARENKEGLAVRPLAPEVPRLKPGTPLPIGPRKHDDARPMARPTARGPIFWLGVGLGIAMGVGVGLGLGLLLLG